RPNPKVVGRTSGRHDPLKCSWSATTTATTATATTATAAAATTATTATTAAATTATTATATTATAAAATTATTATVHLHRAACIGWGQCRLSSKCRQSASNGEPCGGP